MASIVFEQCLLCKSDVSQGTSKVKRKKFYGSKAGKVREIINFIKDPWQKAKDQGLAITCQKSHKHIIPWDESHYNSIDESIGYL